MNTVNTALFILVWTFTAVCRADEDINVTCADVTGFVGKEVHLTCSVSLPNTVCCIQLYKFQHPKDSTICKEEFPRSSCEQRNSITCRYTPTTAMTERFRFFVQTTCDAKTTGFTVNIADPLLIEAEYPVDKDAVDKDAVSKDAVSGDAVDKNPAIAAAVGFFSVLLVIIIIITIICKTKPNFTRACGLQKRMFLCIRHDEDTSDHTEDVIKQHRLSSTSSHVVLVKHTSFI